MEQWSYNFKKKRNHLRHNWVRELESMKINHVTVFFLIAILGGLFLYPEAASAFRCGTRIVNIGDTKWEVLNKCGPPQWQEAWEEKRIDRVYRAPDLDFHRSRESRYPLGVVTYVPVEEWTYNLGPSQFMRILRFEGNRLIRIETGGYGF